MWFSFASCTVNRSEYVRVCQMLQLALRQQQLHAAHMQIKLQHQTNVVASEHNVHEHAHHQHRHHHHHQQQQQQQQQQQRTTLLGVDQLNTSPARRAALPASSSSSDAGECLGATRAASWRTHREQHTSMSTTPHTTLTTADQPPSHAITPVFTYVLEFNVPAHCRHIMRPSA